ncbi:hypothetical protein CN601_12575 [Bacillus sp. AFS017336]|nr:hypothetical protein CN692_03720 [Bacillus sp. AFS002410]PEL10580.1 hypothetical protein CN601_12575 [Bacillus sp. AFS017336]
MKTLSYLSFSLLYLLGLFLLLDFVFKFQNTTFNNIYYTVLYPFLSLFLIGIYASLPKFAKLITKSGLSYHSNEKLKWFVSIILLIILSLIMIIRFGTYPHVLVTILTIFGYVLSLITGYKLIRFRNKNLE